MVGLDNPNNASCKKRNLILETYMTAFLDSLTNVLNHTTTENGAVTHNSSLNSCVDFFAQGGAIRTRSDADIIQMFTPAFVQDKTIAVRLMFMFRDIRGGQGQRRPFRIQLNWLANNYPEQTKPLIDLVAEYGRWDDVYSVMDTPCEAYALHLMKSQVQQDLDNILVQKPISLLGKWLKRINTSSKQSVALGHLTRKSFGISSKDYRKLCSNLNKYLDVVENRMSAKEWDKISYDKVPGQCLIKNRKAFIRNDSERYQEFVSAAQKGEVKVNSGTLYPHQIVGKVLAYNSITPEEAEIMWNNLPDVEVDQNAIVVADVSGSMMGTPMEVSIALAIYFSERAKGVYRDKFITFSTKPTLEVVKGANIFEKVHNLSRAHWDMSTNLEAVFNSILMAAVDSKLAPSDMVGTLYIISDMEFDSCSSVRSSEVESFYESMKNSFNYAGYTIPKLVFWNVDARHNNFPVLNNTPNTCMISGFSPNILKYVTGSDSEVLTPESMMMEVVNSPRYSGIKF